MYVILKFVIHSYLAIACDWYRQARSLSIDNIILYSNSSLFIQFGYFLLEFSAMHSIIKCNESVLNTSKRCYSLVFFQQRLVLLKPFDLRQSRFLHVLGQISKQCDEILRFPTARIHVTENHV